jgi:hypothetical protein
MRRLDRKNDLGPAAARGRLITHNPQQQKGIAATEFDG